jgi:hypothetical protein
VELTSRVEGALAEPAALVRMVPLLQQQVDIAEREVAEAEEVDPEVAAAKDERWAALLQALRAAVNPDNPGLTTGLAIHVAEQAREIDPTSALRAARLALEASELHEAKRRRMSELVAELDPDAEPPEQPESAAPAPTPAPAPTNESVPEPEPAIEAEADLDSESEGGESLEPSVPPAARQHPLYTESPPANALSEEELEALRRRLPPARSLPTTPVKAPVAAAPVAAAPAATSQGRRLELHNGRLASLGEATLVVELEGSRRARVAYETLEAIAVGQVDGLASGSLVVIDLLLNWRSGPSEGQPLRGVRLRLSEIDEEISLDEPEGSSMSGRELLCELLDRAPAAPLPGPDAALGGPIPHFASPADYAKEVLGILRT